jgi:hypothetical protein
MVNRCVGRVKTNNSGTHRDRSLCHLNSSKTVTCRLSDQSRTSHGRLSRTRGKAFGANNDFFHRLY